MMKNKLLAVSTVAEINIGDYIQALASSQFLNKLDGFVQREYLNAYDGEETKMIMNGWYMHHPENWPPSSKIIPLFVSFHINSLAKEYLLSESSLNYLKKHEPIGCRDILTTNRLKEKQINAYFSGCMTLTLGKKYKSERKDDTIYIVDPYFDTNWTIFTIINHLTYLVTHWKSISHIAKKFPGKQNFMKKKMKLTTFYKEYIKFFSQSTLLNAEYIGQQNSKITEDFNSEEEFLGEAERLVKKYAKAKLVITSRIHCALPCLGLETPVIYIEDMYQSEASACRLDGLRELFNIINWNKNHLETTFDIKGKITITNTPKNKDKWKVLANELTKRCVNFLN
jgi:hypothetical protein